MPQTPRFAWRPVAVVTALVVLLLALTASRYGYHRDELYFRMLGFHLAWGYVDQPPMTPLLARAGIALFGDNVVALRAPAIACAALTVVIVALIARELGGDARAQTLAAAGVSSTFLLIAGHVLLTATPDMVVWTLVILFACRALLRSAPRWWLAAGLTVGIGLYNKQLVVLLLLGLAAGLLIAGPRRELASPWLWAGVGIALVLGAPNLVWQATHHWPELTMARTIASDKGHDDRVFFVPLQLVLLGFPSMVIWVVGLVRLLRDEVWRPVRALAWAYPVVCFITLLTGGQPYYTFGILAFLFAAGCVVVVRWASSRRWRWASLAAALVVSEAVALVVALPLIPVGSLGGTPVPGINQAARDTVGWPRYVDQVTQAYDTVPAADRPSTVVIAGNYGEAGAIDRYGRFTVYSGLNQLYYLRRPPESATVAVVVGLPLSFLDGKFGNCVQAGTLDNGVGVDNEEQGRTIAICRQPRMAWRDLWPQFQHYG